MRAILERYSWPRSIRATMDVGGKTIYILRQGNDLSVKVFTGAKMLAHYQRSFVESDLLLLAYGLSGGWPALDCSAQDGAATFRLPSLKPSALICSFDDEKMVSIQLVRDDSNVMRLDVGRYFERDGYRFISEYSDGAGLRYFFKRFEINKRIAPSELNGSILKPVVPFSRVDASA